jgi:uncharacterized protein (DUF849 family)
MPSLKSGIRHERLPTFTKLPRNSTVLATQAGATHLHLHVRLAGVAARVEEEVDLAESFGL